MRECEYCGKSIVRKNAQARFCSDQHRNYARLRRIRNPIPVELTTRDRWVRRSAEKIPLTIDGRNASSTNSSTWSTHAEASTSTIGAGLGFVLGDGIGCIDIDHVLINGTPTEQAARFLESYPKHFIEISPSGDGLHIWGTADEGPGSRKIVDGVSVERYTVGRYITITGNIYQHGELLPL